MNVVLDSGPNNIDPKRKALYIGILVICLLAILISAYVVVFKNDSSGKVEHRPASEEEYLKRELEFEDIFTNETVNQLNQNILITNKIKKEDDIIGIAYESKEKVIGKYTLNIKIPYININTSAVKTYNTEIEQIFKKKALNIMMDSKSKDVIYTVDYIAYVNENHILSIAIRSILKEGNNAQRTIIQTYNYDFKNSKEIMLDEILQTKGLNEKEVESKVVNKIKQEQAKAEELEKIYSDYLGTL